MIVQFTALSCMHGSRLTFTSSMGFPNWEASKHSVANLGNSHAHCLLRQVPCPNRQAQNSLSKSPLGTCHHWHGCYLRQVSGHLPNPPSGTSPGRLTTSLGQTCYVLRVAANLQRRTYTKVPCTFVLYACDCCATLSGIVPWKKVKLSTATCAHRDGIRSEITTQLRWIYESHRCVLHIS